MIHISLSSFLELQSTELLREELEEAYDTLDEYGAMSCQFDKDSFIQDILEEAYTAEMSAREDAAYDSYKDDRCLNTLEK